MTENDLIDRVAKAIYQTHNGHGCVAWRRLNADHKTPYRDDARAALSAISEAIPGLSDVIAGTAVVVPSTSAARDVLNERYRQVFAEGWTPEHDDEHRCGGLALAAASYALNSVRSHNQEVRESLDDGVVPPEWPWSDEYWKPSTPRRDLIKAGALILAEIERLDRLQGYGAPQ